MTKKPKLVRVVWHDAADKSGTWVGDTDAKAFAEVDTAIESVGFLVRETAKYLTIAADWSPEDEDDEETWGRVCKIPVGMVVERKDIEG